jgi:hypothetical protein
LGHMVSKRFARPGYYPVWSSPGFRLTTAYNLNPQSSGSSTGLGQGFSSTSRSKNTFWTKGRYFISTTQVQASTATFSWIPKKQEGSWRLIIDLSRLNRFLRIPHFKMETTWSTAAAMLPGDWAASLDLQDTYLHVPVHPDYQHK